MTDFYTQPKHKSLLQYRKELRLTQSQLAKLLGVALRTYQRYENNEHRQMPLSVATKLARIFNCSMSDFLVPESDNDTIIATEWEKNHSLKAAAQASGCPQEDVIKSLTEQGFILTPEHVEVLKLHDQGATAEQISNALSIDSQLVKIYLL